MNANNLVAHGNPWDVGDYISDETDLPLDGDDKLSVAWLPGNTGGIIAINDTKEWIAYIGTELSEEQVPGGAQIVGLITPITIVSMDLRPELFTELREGYRRSLDIPSILMTHNS